MNPDNTHFVPDGRIAITSGPATSIRSAREWHELASRPTPEAYEAVCRARDKWEALAKSSNADLAAAFDEVRLKSKAFRGMRATPPELAGAPSVAEWNRLNDRVTAAEFERDTLRAAFNAAVSSYVDERDTLEAELDKARARLGALEVAIALVTGVSE